MFSHYHFAQLRKFNDGENVRKHERWAQVQLASSARWISDGADLDIWKKKSLENQYLSAGSRRLSVFHQMRS